MNKLISLLMAGVFFVTSTIQFNYHFDNQYLQNNNSFEDVSEAFNFYVSAKESSSHITEDRLQALYILTELYLDYGNQLSSTQKSYVENQCTLSNIMNFAPFKATLLSFSMGMNIFVGESSVQDFFTAVKNQYTGSDVQRIHDILIDFGCAQPGSIRRISSSGSEKLITAAEEMRDYSYWYTPDGYTRVINFLQSQQYFTYAQFTVFKSYFDRLKEEHPYALFIPGSIGTLTSGPYEGQSQFRFLWIDLKELFSVRWISNSIPQIDSCRFYGLDWNEEYTFTLVTLSGTHLEETEIETNLTNNNIGNCCYICTTPEFEFVNTITYRPTPLSVSSPSYWNMKYFTFGNQNHMLFDDLEAFRAWSIGSHSIYIGTGPTSDVYNQNFNEENYYQTFNYITEAVNGLSPEEFQNGINAVINEISSTGEEVYKETKETNKLLQKIYDKLEAILDQMDDKREDSTSNGGIWIGDLLYFILYLLYAILILADFLSLAASCFDWFNHLWAISPSPGIVAGNEWFIGAHNILHGGVAFGLEEPIVIFGFLTLHDFMVLIFQFAFWAVVISTAKKKATELNIPEIGRRR